MTHAKACILFDIDGTLSNSTGLGSEAMLQAGQSLYGPQFSLTGISFAGSVDPKVYQQIALLNQLKPEDIDEPRFRDLYLECLDEKVKTQAHRINALEGALELVEQCKALPGLTLGVLTGNYRGSGIMKLRASGFDPDDFHIQAFAEVHDCRRELAAHALELIDDHHEFPLEASSVVILGDTPHDVDCAHHNGMLAVAVATGRYSTEELKATGAALVLEDLTDSTTLLDLLQDLIR